jgi:Heterokaryon incompatibility protein (HET)
MDHIKSLEPRRPPNTPFIRLTWLGFEHGSHDLCDFESYPLVHGWIEVTITRLRWETADNIVDLFSVVKMLQSWLFVGALEALTRKRIPTSDFILQNNPQNPPRISTAFMGPLLETWRKSLKEIPADEQEKSLANASSILAEVNFWCLKLCDFSSSDKDVLTQVMSKAALPPSSALDQAIDDTARLITLVGEAIGSYVATMGRRGNSQFRGCYTFSQQARLARRLRRVGWCPFVARVMMEYRYSIAEYACSWPVQGIYGFHDQCSTATCISHNIDEEHYHNRHATKKCVCDNVKPPFAEIQRIVLQGGIPVVNVIPSSSSPSREVTIEAMDAKDLTPPNNYITISHVWSDGMGSTTGKGLPGCLLEILDLYVRHLKHEYFWIDSLCIPSDKSLRKRAIGTMATIYQSSDTTLVLDRSLESVTFMFTEPDKLEIILLRFVFCPWMQRLWTLQEALLSKKLVIRFRNCMASITQVFDLAAISLRLQVNPVAHVLGREVMRLFQLSPHYTLENNNNSTVNSVTLADVQRMITIRNTTKLGDETLAVAGLVGIDPELLIQSSSEQDRMKIFLRLLKNLDKSILFLEGERMDEYGWKWAKKSFLANSQGKLYVDPGRVISPFGNETAECLEEGGLCGKFWLLGLPRTVDVQDGDYALLRLSDRLLVRLVPGSSNKGNCITFDSIIILHSMSVNNFQIGVCSFLKADERFGSLPIFEYTGNVVVRVVEDHVHDRFDKDRIVEAKESFPEVVIR